MSDLSLDEYLNRLQDRLSYHHDAAQLLFKTHKQATHVLRFIVAALNRSLFLVDGFGNLIRDNYICAAPITRLQFDSVLRFSALSLVADMEDFATRVASGEKFRKLRDRDGQPMTDAYLVKKLNERFPGMDQHYEDGCGYVHFSKAHLFHIQSRTADGGLRIEVGREAGVEEQHRKDAIFLMDQSTRMLLIFMEAYLQQKDPSIVLLPPEWQRTYSST